MKVEVISMVAKSAYTVVKTFGEVSVGSGHMHPLLSRIIKVGILHPLQQPVHIGKDPQPCHLFESNPHRGETSH